MSHTLDFDEARHVYHLDGEMVPGITSRLRLAGLVDTSFFNEAARLRGTAVHLATQFLDEGNLALDSVDERIRGYLAGWQKFMAESGFRITDEPELLVASPTLRYATKIDRVGMLAGKPIILNLKTSASPYPWWQVQLAGEAHAFAEWCDVPRHSLQRMSVQVLADGQYRAHFYNDRRDYQTWAAVVETATWIERHGPQKREEA